MRTSMIAGSILLALLAAAGGDAETQGTSGATTVVRDARVVDLAGGPARVRTVVVRGGRIVSVSAAGDDAPGGASVVDGRGRFLIPGLWDMHVHLATRPEPGVAERIMLPVLLAHGVVGVRDMGGPAARVLALRAGTAAGSIEGPRIITPGPFLDGPGAQDPMFRRVEDAGSAGDALHELTGAGVDFFKVQAGLAPGVHKAIVSNAARRGIVVAGHVPVAMSAWEVAASGQRSLEHLSPALVGDAGLLFACSSQEQALRVELLAIERDRGSVAAAALRAREASLRQRLIESYDPARAHALGLLLAERDVWIVPTLIWSNSLRPLTRADEDIPELLAYVPAAARARLEARRAEYLKVAGDGDLAAAADVARASARALRDLHAAGARVLAGTDAFDGFVLPGISLHQELALLVRAGLSPLAALRAATVEAAAYRGDRHAGDIAVGMRGDMVLLDADPLADIRNTTRIDTVILDGRVYPRGRLDALLAGAREAAAR